MVNLPNKALSKQSNTNALPSIQQNKLLVLLITFLLHFIDINA